MDINETQTGAQREGIIAEYADDGLGYLIQKAEGGYRYICVEAGEEDELGEVCSTRRGAIAAAVADWREYGQGDRWADWSRKMAADSVAPDRVEADTLAEVIAAQVGGVLTEAQVRALSVALADLIN